MTIDNLARKAKSRSSPGLFADARNYCRRVMQRAMHWGDGLGSRPEGKGKDFRTGSYGRFLLTLSSGAKALFGRIRAGHAASLVKERLLDVSRLSRALRWAVWTTYVILAGTAILIAFHGRLEKTQPLSVVGMQFASGVFDTAILLLLIALILLFTGAMLANAWLRWSLVGCGAIIAIGCICFAPKAPGQQPGGNLWVAFMPLLSYRFSILYILLFLSVPLLLAVAAILVHKVRPLYVGALCASSLVLLFTLVAFFHIRYSHQFGYTPVLLGLIELLFISTPVLLVVGFDLVDWGLLLGGFVTDGLFPKRALVHETRRQRGTEMAALVVWAIAILNVVIAALTLNWARPATIALSVITIIALAVFFLLAFRASSSSFRHGLNLRYWTLLGLATLVYFAGYFTYMFRMQGQYAPPPVYNHEDDPFTFSTIFPSNWKVYPWCNLTADDIKALETRYYCVEAAGDSAVVKILGYSSSQDPPVYLNDIISSGDQFPQTRLQFTQNGDDIWQSFQTTLTYQVNKNPIDFVVWHGQIDSPDPYMNANWYILGVCAAKHFADAEPKFAAVRDQWLPNVRTIEIDRPSKLIYGIWGILAALGLILLVVARRSRWNWSWALLSAAASILMLHNALGLKFNDAAEGLSRSQIFSSAQMSIACVSLVFLIWCLGKNRQADIRWRVLHTSFLVNMGLLLASCFMAIYHYGSAESEVNNFFKGVFILGALGLDVVISGEMTNRSTRFFPQNSRLLLFLGYVLGVAASVFVFFHETYRFAPVTSVDAEVYVERGILTLGLPLILVVFSARFSTVLPRFQWSHAVPTKHPAAMKVDVVAPVDRPNEARSAESREDLPGSAEGLREPAATPDSLSGEEAGHSPEKIDSPAP